MSYRAQLKILSPKHGRLSQPRLLYMAFVRYMTYLLRHVATRLERTEVKGDRLLTRGTSPEPPEMSMYNHITSSYRRYGTNRRTRVCCEV